MTFEDHFGTDHGWDSGGVGDGLGVGFCEGFLVVADVVDVFLEAFAVFDAVDYAADAGFSFGEWSERCWVWEDFLEELEW